MSKNNGAGADTVRMPARRAFLKAGAAAGGAVAAGALAPAALAAGDPENRAPNVADCRVTWAMASTRAPTARPPSTRPMSCAATWNG